MSSRLVWLAVGVGIGVAAARRLEQQPAVEVVEAAAGRAVRQVRRTVDAIVADGRAEMHEREARLRTVLAAPRARSERERWRGATGGER